MIDDFSSYLKKKLYENKLTQKELSKKSGVSESTISRIVSGERGKRPSFEILNRLAQGLNIPTSDLVQNSGWNYDDFTQNKIVAESSAEYKTPKDLQIILEQHEVMFQGEPLDDEDKKEILNIIQYKLYERAKELNKRKK